MKRSELFARYWFFQAGHYNSLIEIAANEYFEQVQNLVNAGIENNREKYDDFQHGDSYVSVIHTDGCDYIAVGSKIAADDIDCFYCKRFTITKKQSEEIRKFLDTPVSIF